MYELTWHFCKEKIPKKIGKIQERVIRFIYGDYDSSYEILLPGIRKSGVCGQLHYSPLKSLTIYIPCI